MVITFPNGQCENARLTVPLEKIKKDDDYVDYQNYRYVFDRLVEIFSKDEILEVLKRIDTERGFKFILQNNKSNSKK